MKNPSFLLYGYTDKSDEAKLLELYQSSLVFRDIESLEKFIDFLSAYLAGLNSGESDDHEHFFGDEPYEMNIIVSMMDK